MLLVGYATTSATPGSSGNKVGVILPVVLVPVIAILAGAVAGGCIVVEVSLI